MADIAQILIVDDDRVSLVAIEANLQANGHEVAALGSGEEAIEFVTKIGPPQVAILDVFMPKMSGFQLARALRAIAGLESLPVIFLSGLGDPEDIEAGERLGAIYLTKPVELAALLSAIEASVPS